MPTLTAQDVHIRLLRTQDLSPAAMDAIHASLSREERARSDRFRCGDDARDYAAAHALLRFSLSAYRPVPVADWRFKTSASGKPAIDSPDPQLTRLSFSLTHMAGLVACAIADRHAIGVDLERADRRFEPLEIARRYFSQEEADSLATLEGDARHARFIELWTLKEAYLKATGAGLSGSLADPAFYLSSPDAIAIHGATAQRFRFALFEIDDASRLSVAVDCAETLRFTLYDVEGFSAREIPAASVRRRFSHPACLGDALAKAAREPI